MKILITGATGFVGQTLVRYFYTHSLTDLCLLVRDEAKVKDLFSFEELEVISTANSNWMRQVSVYNPDIVIHLATYFTGQRDEISIQQLVDSNLLFTVKLLEALSYTKCSHFINIGTFTEFMDGGGEYLANNLYSATKTAIRPIIAYYQTVSKWNWINVVVYSPYGRKNNNKKVIDYLVDAVGAQNPIAFSPGEQILDFIHVDDIADFFLTLLSRLGSLEKPYYQFHLGTGIGHTVREVARMVEKVFGKPVNAIWGGRDYSPTDVMHAVAPINKNLSLLGWKAHISLEKGISILRDDIAVNV